MTANGKAARSKGKKAERDARDYLRGIGVACHKPQDEALDLGDLVLGDHPIIFQVKHYEDTLRAIREAINGAHLQATHWTPIGVPGMVGIGIVRPNGEPDPAQMLVCFRLHQMPDVLDAFNRKL